MGNKPGGKRQSDIETRVEEKIGKIPLSGRYHKSPKVMEDDYEVCNKVLGSGYNGVVRLATSKGPASGKNGNQKFAVKAFKLSHVAADKKAQLESEVEIFLVMDHPHITRLYDVYEGEDHLYLVMECCEGGELFDRVTELKRFSERDAADAVWQMLLSLNYIHSHGMVHRDIKLENFLYDQKDSNHLKLIDFGFSKIWDPNIKMKVSCGTLSYVAPEVLEKNYTSQCDVWSLGVITFILLAGYMPFHGPEAQQTKNIQEGKYNMKPERWNNISKEGTNFVKSLLQVDANKRLTAQAALDHKWMETRHHGNENVDEDVAMALRQFGSASKFRRACMEMMAWSLSNDERAKVRQYFINMDHNHHGTITLQELRSVLVDKFHIEDEEVKRIFHALDSNHDEEIHYSDFLAAMVSTRIALHDDLLRSAFKRFDTDNSGFITVDNLRQVLGDHFDGEDVEKLLAEGDLLKDGKISYPEFVAYLKGSPLDEHAHAINQVIDHKLGSQHSSNDHHSYSFLKGVPKMVMKAGSTKGCVNSGEGGTHDVGHGHGSQTSLSKKDRQPKCGCLIT